MGRPRKTKSGVRINPKTGKAETGRPTKMTPEVLRKLEEVFAIGGSDEEACFYADIGMTTLYEYQTANPDFANRKKALKQKPILKARQEVVRGLEGNPEFSLKYLERKRKKEFSLRTELTGAEGQEIKIRKITDDKLESDNGADI